MTTYQTYHIRNITPADDPLIADIVRSNLEQYQLAIPGTAYFDPELAHLSQYYGADPAKRAYFIAESGDGHVLGGAGIAEFSGFAHCAELQKIYLIDDAKGKGIGRKLLDTVMNFAREADYQTLYLETHSNLAAAIHLYEKTGFQRIEKPDCVLHSTMNCFYLKQLKEFS